MKSIDVAKVNVKSNGINRHCEITRAEFETLEKVFRRFNKLIFHTL